jgi:hypothetical protein
MPTENKWMEEAKQRAASKRGAKWVRFMAPGDEPPKDDEETITVPIGATVEGIVLDLSETVTKFGTSAVATVDDADYGPVKVLAGPKMLKDLIAGANVGDFVSMTWNGKRVLKDGTGDYRHWDVSHFPAPGSTPKERPAAATSTVSLPDADDDDEDPF